MSRTAICQGCGVRCRAYRLCQGCKSKHFHVNKRIEREGLIVDTAGGSWWVWDAKGEVLVIGRDSKFAAKHALATGNGLDDSDDDLNDECS